MKKKKLILLGSGAVAVIALIFVFVPRAPHSHEHPHGHDHGTHAHGADHELHASGQAGTENGVRRSRVLEDPRYQEPPSDPLLEVVALEKLLDGPFMGARFAADGKHLLLTGENFRGLWVALRDGSGLKQISDGYMAGWRPVTTRDGDLIYRVAELDENGVVVGFTLYRYDLETGVQELLYDGPNEDVYPPWLTRDEQIVLILRDGEVVGRPLGNADETIPLHERDEGFAYADGGQVFFRHLATDEPIPLSSDPEATGGEVASPCGTYVAYLSGNADSAFIVNLQTGTEIDIGEGSNLAWSPDGRFLLYDVIVDDGHRILDSELFIIEADGANRQRITFDSQRAFHNPSWSPDGNFFAAEDAHTGEIFLFQVAFTSNHNDNSK